MEKNSSLRSLHRKVIALLLFLIPVHLSAQEFILSDSVKIPRPINISKDQSGNIYLTDQKGKVIRYSKSFDNKLIYSPDKPARVTSMETWQGLRVLIFYQDIQEYTLLNRFLDGPSNYELNDPAFIFITAATLSYDNNLWLFDQQGLKLIKYNTSGRAITFQKPLDLIINKPLENIIAFREYQNRVYLIDSKAGMYIFDNLGNYILNIDFPEVSRVGFYEDYIYYTKHEKLIYQHLYNQQEVETNLPVKGSEDVVRSKFGLYVFRNEVLYRFMEK